jgi:cation transporter-like permease
MARTKAIKTQMSEVAVNREHWMNSKWRPMMGWTYMLTCLFDFIVGPIFYNLLQFYSHANTLAMWQPLTLGGGGLYHLAMGAVLGVAAWSRGQEKIANISSVSGTSKAGSAESESMEPR